MAQLTMPHGVSKALNFQYRIPTNQFIRKPLTDKSDNAEDPVSETDKVYGWEYTSDICVGKHPDYPDIPPSAWTVTLTVMDRDDEADTISSTVEPKEGREKLKSPKIILVDTRFESGWEYEDGGFCQLRIGPRGTECGHGDDLDSLVDTFRFRGSKNRHCSLLADDEVYVLVSLTFIVEETAERRDLQTLLTSGMLTDCTLICGGQQFRAHRAILSAQSPVFAAMFQSGMTEQSSGMCTIKDISAGALEVVLEYAYTRDLKQKEDDLDKVWDAADKYDMADLKIECERMMLGSIKEGSAVKYMTFAADRGLKQLMIEAARIVGRQSV